MRKLLIATCLSLGIVFIWRRLYGEPIAYKDFVFGIVAFVPLIKIAIGRSGAKPFRLSPSFSSGLNGGFIGGALGGLLMGVTYFVQFSSLDESVTLLVIPENIAFASFGGLVLGAFTVLMILWFRYLVTERNYPSLVFNDVTGGILGGAISGFFVGGLAGVFFGFLHQYFLGTIPLVTGSVLGAVFVAAGALFYDYGGLWRNVMRAFIASLLFTACTVTGGIMALQHLDITRWFFFETTGTLVTEGGAILGAVIGMVSGGQVGLTLFLYRLWEPTGD